jgi:hypothetical protein
MRCLMFVFFTAYYYDGQIKEDEKGTTCTHTGNMRNAHKSLAGISEGKRPLVRLVH